MIGLGASSASLHGKSVTETSVRECHHGRASIRLLVPVYDQEPEEIPARACTGESRRSPRDVRVSAGYVAVCNNSRFSELIRCLSGQQCGGILNHRLPFPEC